MTWLTSIFSSLGFTNPLALGALLLLPIIYWLLRFTPPKPQSVKFPPFRLLLGLISKEQESDHTPWWLIILRLTLATVIILAIAGPILGTSKNNHLNQDPLLILIDNDWSTANDWPRRQAVLQQIITAADIKGVPIALVPSNQAAQPIAFQFTNARTAKELANAIQPQSQGINRLSHLAKVTKAFGNAKALQIIWLSNGRSNKTTTTTQFTTGLKKLAGAKASLKVFATSAANIPLVLGTPTRKDGKIIISAYRNIANTPTNARINLVARNGRSLASKPIKFDLNKTTATLEMKLPLALRNEASRIEISGQRHGAAIHLLDDRWRRKTVGIVSGENRALSQPLLSPLYYVSRALSPSAQLIEQDDDTSTAKLLQSGLSMLVMADIGTIAPKDRTALEKWVNSGGVLVRFAGPRLAKTTGGQETFSDPLIPVELRRGGRALGSALSWEKPQSLAPFTKGSPLAGLKLNTDVKVTRQILAEPTSQLAGHVWASLQDGTPLITASPQGTGLVVLIHVTANPDWSDLPLSGLFVDILNRILDLAPAVTTTKQTQTTFEPGIYTQGFSPQSSLNGFGRLSPPPTHAKAIKLTDVKTAKISNAHPAGLYKRGPSILALNLKVKPSQLTSLAQAIPQALSSQKLYSYEPAPVFPLAAWFFIAAFVLALIDSLAALFLMGGIERLKRTKPALMLLGLFIAASFLASLSLNAPLLNAQELSPKDKAAMEAVDKTRLAYVKTGNEVVDLTSLAGLNGLNLALSQRTAVEPGFPQGIDLEQDEITFYPLLYWPILKDTKIPSDKVTSKLKKFMKNGGTIFFDTRDESVTMQSLFGTPSPKTLALRRVLAKFDIPALEPVPARHVLTRSFYLMQHFPGRYLGGKLWVEASSTDKSQIDGVSSIIIGSNDYAAAWAIGGDHKPLFATIPGAPRQREFAYRTGINIVMYTLTGNYKADQVHIPALLRRLGQ